MLCLKYWDSSSPAVARMQQATAKANAAPQTADVCRANILALGRTHSGTQVSCLGQGGVGLAALVQSSPMPKGKKTKTAIYHPPKSGMPYLVVTVSPEGVTATAVESKEEARVLASKKTMKVDFQEASRPSEPTSV
jgi:hypothetical protein